MRIRRVISVLAFLFVLSNLNMLSSKALAQAANGKHAEEASIRGVLDAQVAAWNRGDVSSFMEGYENSPETTFVGATTVNKGFAPILERYKQNYSTHEQMGTLTFKDLDIRLLPEASGATEYAVVTGKFHLERNARGAAAKDDGIFSLVWHKGPGGWKILLDHSA